MGLVRASVCAVVSPGPWREQRWRPHEDRMWPPGLEKGEVGSSRNLTWLCIAYLLARGGNPSVSVDDPLQILGDNIFPGIWGLGVLDGAQLSTVGVETMDVSCDCYVVMLWGAGAGGPQCGLRSRRLSLFRCLKGWDGTSVYLAKEILPVVIQPAALIFFSSNLFACR